MPFETLARRIDVNRLPPVWASLIALGVVIFASVWAWPGMDTKIIEAAKVMTWQEIVGTVFSAACVFLAVKRNVWTYPIGIVGTIAFFFLFWNLGLYSSALLQIFFTAVQFYGWWFWLKGDRGNKPRITSINYRWAMGGILVAGLGSLLLSLVTTSFGAAVPGPDAFIFGLSVVAQFFLDRKKLENWIVWFGVNVVSIYVYGSQGLVLTTILYVVFLLNAVYGYLEWRKEKVGYATADEAANPGITVWDKGVDV